MIRRAFTLRLKPGALAEYNFGDDVVVDAGALTEIFHLEMVPR